MNDVRADLADGAGLIGVYQCIGRADGNGLIHRGQLKLDCVFRRKRGTNFHRNRYCCKAGLRNFEPIDAVGQPLHVERALIAGRQGVPVLIRRAGNLNRRFHAQAGRIGHFKAQFAAIALAKERKGADKKKSCKSLRQDSASPFCLCFFKS